MKQLAQIGYIDTKLKDSKNYFSSSKVVKELTPVEFDPIKTFNLKSSSRGKCTFIMFYAPWCGYCKRSKELWEQLGHAATFIDVCALNCEKYKNHVGKMNMDKPGFVGSFPTLVMYKGNIPFKKFDDERTLQNLLDFCMMYKK